MSMDLTNLNDLFLEWIHQQEGFHIRSERLGELTDRKVALDWLREAFMQGAFAMANDPIDALNDYACAMSGIDYPTKNPSQAFDSAAENLSAYYQQIFKDFDNGSV